MKLRNYQSESVLRIEEEWYKQGHSRTLLVLPTGTGKTVVFSEIVRRQAAKNENVLILAHRDELLSQAADKLRKASGLEAVLEKATSHAITSVEQGQRVVVASMQTLAQEVRLKEWPSNTFGTIIIDEAHHAASSSYKRIIDHFAGYKLLGVTATPYRADKKALSKYFDSVAYEYTLVDAVKDGYLVPLKAQMIPLEIDLSKVRISAGDYQLDEAGAAIEPYLEQIAQHMAQHCMGRKTVVFLPLISTSLKMCRYLNECGFNAAHVDGESKNRAEILADFEAGKYNVLCNSMLLTEGWDCPPVDCIVPLRPTQSHGLYAQMVGRGTRLSPETGKKDLLIMDFLWMTEKHDLAKPATLVAKTARAAAKIDEMITADTETDLLAAEQMAMEQIIAEESKAAAEREAALARKLKEQDGKKKRLVDPLKYAASLNIVDLFDYEPVYPWEMDPPTEKQLEMLEKFHVNTAEITCKGAASKLLDVLIKRAQDGMSTLKQIRKLEQWGYVNVADWTKVEATWMIDQCKDNGWRPPVELRPGMPRSVPKRLRVSGW